MLLFSPSLSCIIWKWLTELENVKRGDSSLDERKLKDGLSGVLFACQ